MSTKQLGCIVQFILIFSAIQISHAQNIPTPADFDRALKTCATSQNIGLPLNITDSISKLYASESSRQILKSSTDFLQIIPENMRIEAYRLYADCIAKIAPQIANTATPSTPIETSTYRVCTGEYERACQPHEVYLYCYDNVEAWAKNRCTSYNLRRLNSYGGNKCGYSLDEVRCIGPK
jgi:hypothetical protein